jgi:hypothetical protein
VKELIANLILTLEEKFPVNRVVVLLTPVFAALSGTLATWWAAHVSWLELTQGQLLAVFIAGVGAALPPVYVWLRNWAAHEARLAAAAVRVGREVKSPVTGAITTEKIQAGTIAVPPPETPEDAERRRMGYPPAGEGI